MVDRAGPPDPAADACRLAPRGRASRLRTDPRDQLGRAGQHRLPGPLFVDRDDFRRRLRSLPAPEGRLDRTRDRLDPALADADGPGIQRAAADAPDVDLPRTPV